MAGRTAWGTQSGARWIAAPQFSATLQGGPLLHYETAHFYNSPGSATPTRYFAQLDVEPGALVDKVSCVYDDPSSTNNVRFTIQRYTANVSTGARNGSFLADSSSTGAPGVGVRTLSLDPAETITSWDGEFLLTQYFIGADVADDTSIAGCWVSWKRQVAPGPATATFSDVPTSSPYFRFVEALVESGVTGGCGGNNYCPDSPITRGQMAVFLAAALGMGFPY